MIKKYLLKKYLQSASRAQAIVLIAVAFAGMVAIVGLLTDGGMLLIQYARLKRAVDASSIAGAAQFRKNFTQTDLTNAAEEFLQLNQSDVIPSSIHVDTCDTQPGDPVLCVLPLRKLVRVTASRQVTFGFLRILGINSTTITASSIGEAASVDLMFVVDTSISMAAATTGDPNTIDSAVTYPPNGDDPSRCNPTNTCQPMANIKAVAQAFANKLFYPYDRVGVVALTGQATDGTANRDPVVVWKLQSTGNGATDQANVDNALSGLKVFQPRDCNQPISSDNQAGPCLNYPPDPPYNGTFAGQECPIYRLTNPSDPTTCNSTNGGGGLYWAGYGFTDPTIQIRKDSFWAVILLLSGTPNSSYPWPGDTGHPYGYCPDYATLWTGPLCIQPSMNWQAYPPTPDPTRHIESTPPPSADYTSLDYARDMADWVTSPTNGQGASIYSIGLGNRVEHSSTYNGIADPAEAEAYMKYASYTAGGPSANHGAYYYDANPSDYAGLSVIFDAIYQNITTRISQ